MSSKSDELLRAAMKLSEDDRRCLGEALLDSVPRESDEEITAAWREEVMSRVDEVRRGEAVTESISEVKARLNEALESV